MERDWCGSVEGRIELSGVAECRDVGCSWSGTYRGWESEFSASLVVVTSQKIHTMIRECINRSRNNPSQEKLYQQSNVKIPSNNSITKKKIPYKQK